MPINGRRRLIRSVGDSNWTSTIPSAYTASFLDIDIPYSEIIVHKIKSFHRYVEEQRLPRGYNGSRSLKDAAIEVLLSNLSELDNLNDLPKHLTRCLWHTLKRRCMLSFHSWKVLSKSLYKDSDVTLGMLHYSKVIKCPRSLLQVYTQPLISATFDFITALSVSGIYSVVELVQLAKIPNLGILEIINPGPQGQTPGVGDIVLRAWSREAENNGAFPVLRILRLRNHEDLTGKSLPHLQSFPALVLFDVSACSIVYNDKLVLEAEKLGWVIIWDTNLVDVLEEKCNERRQKVSAGSSLGFQPAEKRFTKPLWPGSRVSRAKRSSIPSSFAHSIIKSKGHLSNIKHLSNDTYLANNNQSLEDSHRLWAANSSLNTTAASWPNCVREVAEGDEQWVSLSWDIFCSTRDKAPWESSYAACWTLLGEICEDSDLMMAGVKGIEEQTFVGPHLVSPIPMAYLRLGDVHESLGLWEASSTKSVPKSLEEQILPKGRLTFIRTGQNSRPLLPSQSASDIQLDRAMSGKRRPGALERARPFKKQKQNLNDVLNGFKAG